MGKLAKIAAEDLRAGMYVHELEVSWISHPFWRSKFVVEDEHIHSIIESGISEVWVDLELGNAPQSASSIVAEEAQVRHSAAERESDADCLLPIPPKPASMADEVSRARQICLSASRAVKAMFQEARLGKTISMDAAGRTVEEISMSVMRNPQALISVARLKHADDYTYMHSVAVCALMIALARRLDLDAADTREAGMAGLLHDIGKVSTPPGILNKVGKLTQAEFAIIKKHPVQGHALLRENLQASEVTLDVCLHHHERIDGKGYPHGLAGNQISLFAKMGAVCDVYDAITSNRPYKKGWCPAESIKKMAEWSAGQYDKKVFDAFVASVGIYPVGALVRLASGKLGVVVEQSAKSLVAPKVKVFFSTKSGVYITPTIIDLSHTMADANAEKIVGYEDASLWKIKDFDEMWAT